MTTPFFSPPVLLWCWFAATCGHFVLTWRWCARAGGDGDERFFLWAVTGVGGLALVLHVVASLTGLGFLQVVTGLVVWHLALAAIVPRTPADVPRADTSASTPPAIRAAELIALALAIGALFTWVDLSSRSLTVSGTDATNYHAPYAVNLALGANLFSLPATMHLYPMAGSVVAAWFILPLGDALLIDLAMSLWVLLFAASALRIFRAMTGHSGAAWASWLAMAIFSVPIMRGSAYFSADLVFAAAFLALLAALAQVWSRQAWRTIDAIAAGLALGVLLGSKATGVAAAALLACVFAVWVIVHRLRARRGWLLPSAWLCVLAIVCVTGAGGIWLIRNRVLFGWFVEGWGPTLQLSVMGDATQRTGYSVWGRMLHYIGLLFGGWFLLSLLPIVAFLADLVTSRRASDAATRRSTRLFVLAAIALNALVIFPLLYVAPWTSLEWTEGLSLRYALHVWAALPLLAFAGLFPLTWRWYESRQAVIGLAVAAVIGLALFFASQQPSAPRFAPEPAVMPIYAALGVVLVLGARAMTSIRTRTRVAVGLLIFVAAVSGWTRSVESRDRRERAIDEIALQARWKGFAASIGADDVPFALYYETLRSEVKDARPCERRRFFSLVRFDAPLALQSVDDRNQVFYAGRDVALAKRGAPLDGCDYVITTRPIMDTIKGAAIVDALRPAGPLREVATVGAFVMLRAPARQ